MNANVVVTNKVRLVCCALFCIAHFAFGQGTFQNLGLTNWSLGVSLSSGTNTISVQGYERLGVTLTNAYDSIIVTKQP